MSTTPTTLSKLRHLYENMVNGGVRDTASAKRIAEGLLSPAIAELERAALTQGAGEALVDKSPDLQGSLVDKPANLQGQAGAAEPFAYAVECYPHRADIFKGETAYEFREQGDPKDAIFTAQQLQQAVARALEELKFHPQASHVEPNYRDWFNKTIDAAIRAKGTHD